MRILAVVLLVLLAGLAGLVPTGDPAGPQDVPAPPVVAAATAFVPNIRITDDSSPLPHQVEPFLVRDGQGRLFVGWKEAETADGPGARVGFARSLDGGLTWSPNVLMDRVNPNRRQSDPWLAVDASDRLYYARLEYAADLRQDGVMVSRSDDGGASWGPIADVDDRSGFADKESLASDGNGSLYVAYDDVDRVNNVTDIRFTRSRDGGMTWSATTAVVDAPGGVVAPVIAPRPNGTVYVAWWDVAAGNIMVDVSRDRGATWGADVRVNAVPGSAWWDDVNAYWRLSLPSAATNGSGSLFVAWPDRGNGDLDIVVARSDDGGATWSTPMRVNDDTSGRDQWMVALAVDGRDVLHAAWVDNRTGNLNVFYANSTDGGETWSSNVRVTTQETPNTTVRPGDYLGLAADDDGTVYVVWTDGRGEDLDIYFARNPGFGPLHDVTFRTEPEGRTFSVDGVVYNTTVTLSLVEGSEHRVAALAPQAEDGTADPAPSVGTRYAFSRWSDDGPEEHVYVVTGPDTLTAFYRKQHYLGLTSPYGTPQGEGWYLEGALAAFRVDAVVEEGDTRRVFVAWTGDASLQEPEGTVLMDGPKAVEATWRTEHFVSVVSEVPGVQGEGWYADGSTARLEAPGSVLRGLTLYLFVRWRGDVDTAQNPLTVPVDGPVRVQAEWNRVDFLPVLLAALGAVVLALLLVRRRRRRRWDETWKRLREPPAEEPSPPRTPPGAGPPEGPPSPPRSPGPPPAPPGSS
jgi:hypothetical protein